MPRLAARFWNTGAATAPTPPQKPQFSTTTGMPAARNAQAQGILPGRRGGVIPLPGIAYEGIGRAEQHQQVRLVRRDGLGQVRRRRQFRRQHRSHRRSVQLHERPVAQDHGGLHGPVEPAEPLPALCQRGIELRRIGGIGPDI